MTKSKILQQKRVLILWQTQLNKMSIQSVDPFDVKVVMRAHLRCCFLVARKSACRRGDKTSPTAIDEGGDGDSASASPTRKSAEEGGDREKR